MKRRVFGVETEYGITFVPGASCCQFADVEPPPPALATGGEDNKADWAAKLLFRPFIKRGRTSNMFLPNGGRLYLDVGSHPEYATAECDKLMDLLAQDRAGQDMLADLADQTNRELINSETAGQIHLFKNNLDSQSNSYGCHENYLLRRRRDFREFADALVSFFVTRQVLTGAGHLAIDKTTGQVDYHFSQRADQMWDAVSAASTRARPIINTRDEPHADAELYRRLHVIVGDSNVSEAVTLLKVGMTNLLLSAAESGLYLADLALAHPMQAIREISADITGKAKVELTNGKYYTAVDIQTELLQRLLPYIQTEWYLDDAHKYVVDLWNRGLQALHSDNFSRVNTELDWVVKRELLAQVQKRRGGEVSAVQLQRINLAYHDITGSSLSRSMEQKNMLHRVTTDEQVQRAKEFPPTTTRAHLRGMAIATAHKYRRDIAADWVHIRCEDGVSGTIALKDPFATQDERVSALLEKMESA